MVNKVKKYIVFVLFSMLFQLLHNKIQGVNEGSGFFLVPSAEAKCCPAGTTHLDSDGRCCNDLGICY